MDSPLPERPDLNKLKARIQGLRAKTVENGCTEHEAIAAAAKVAALLDQYDLSLTDVEIRQDTCERAEYDTWRKNGIPLDGCVAAIADFADCRIWHEKNQFDERRYIFFGRQADVAVAHYLCDLIDRSMLIEVARFKCTPGYLGYRPGDRKTASNSFLHGMAASIAAKLREMKAQRDEAHRATGRDLVLVKAALVDEELAKLGMSFTTRRQAPRTIAKHAFYSGHAAGRKIVINPGIGAGGSDRRVERPGGR